MPPTGGAPFVDAECRVRRRRIVENRAGAPIETLAVLRRQKEVVYPLESPAAQWSPSFFGGFAEYRDNAARHLFTGLACSPAR